MYFSRWTYVRSLFSPSTFFNLKCIKKMLRIDEIFTDNSRKSLISYVWYTKIRCYHSDPMNLDTKKYSFAFKINIVNIAAIYPKWWISVTICSSKEKKESGDPLKIHALSFVLALVLFYTQLSSSKQNCSWPNLPVVIRAIQLCT